MVVRSTEIQDRARRWGARPENSARSVLVTILGDTVAPLGGTVWLADLIALAAPFGYNERLVRTSMFRLVAERWVVNERIGRRSQYRLTPFGRDEFADADARIYRRGEPEWNGRWTLVFLTGDVDRVLTQHLRWHGYGELTSGVFASPTDDAPSVRQLFDRLHIDTRPLVATAHFDELAAMTRAGPFRDSSGLTATEASYREFVERYRSTSELDGVLSPEDAFLLRTMVIHDLRRVRLRDPELPRALLPDHWIGTEAVELAGSLYLDLVDASWEWIETLTGLTVDATDPSLTRRFSRAA